MRPPAFLARQLARPSGWFGRHVMGRMLNRGTMAHAGLVFEDLAASPGDRVLEVGFGGGWLLGRLCEAAGGGRVMGVEISPEMLALARSTLRRFIEAGTLEVREAGVERLPFPDESVDAACTVNTTYFWPDLDAGLRELHRVVRPGGRLVVGILDADDMRRAGFHERGFATHSPAQLATALEAAGFRPGAVRSGRDSRGRFYSLAATRRTKGDM